MPRPLTSPGIVVCNLLYTPWTLLAQAREPQADSEIFSATWGITTCEPYCLCGVRLETPTGGSVSRPLRFRLAIVLIGLHVLS